MFPFDRLVQAVDQWITHSGYRDVLIQIGAGKYSPALARSVRMMSPWEFNEAIRTCDLMVAHVGMGSIISAAQAQKPVILLPRHRSLGEHTSDHQLHATEWLRGLPGLWIADDIPALHRLLDEFVQGRICRLTTPASQVASFELIENVKNFIRGD